MQLRLALLQFRFKSTSHHHDVEEKKRVFLLLGQGSLKRTSTLK